MFSKFIGSVFIVSGISIGAGMLAMPLTASFVDYPTCLCVLFLFWAGMYYATLVNLEANLRVQKGVSISEITSLVFGKKYGAFVSISLGIFLCALVSAYIAGETSLIQSALGGRVSKPLISTVFTLVFGGIVYSGMVKLDRMNRFFLTLKFFFLIGMIAFLAQHVRGELLVTRTSCSWDQWSLLLPVFFTSFGFQACIPYLVDYCDYNAPLLKRVILTGTLIPFLTYAVWILVTKGVLALEGPASFAQVHAQGGGIGPFIEILSAQSGSLEVKLFNTGYSLLAMTTSFLGVGLALYLFMEEKISSFTKSNSRATILCTFLPPWLVVQFYPEGFVMALKYAAAFLSLFALLAPAACVWKLRTLQDNVVWQAPGGKAGLILMITIGIAFMILGGR